VPVADELIRSDVWRIADRRVSADWIYENPSATDLPWTLPSQE
jgi:hypothetical protein